MSMGGAYPPGRGEVGPAIASYPTYEAAQKAVSALIAGDVPAREIAIVGIGLRSIERVTGRLGYAAAARSGAFNGILLGLFFSALFVLGSPVASIQAFVGVLFVGIAIGMLLNLLMYAILRRRRDFASVMQFVADRYEVTVAAGNAMRAREILGPSAPPPPPTGQPVSREAPPAPADREPPRYGQRIADVPAPPVPEPPVPEPPVSELPAPEDEPPAPLAPEDEPPVHGDAPPVHEDAPDDAEEDEPDAAAAGEPGTPDQRADSGDSAESGRSGPESS